MIHPQLFLGADVHDRLVVDLFAGGGGASCGIEMGLGRMVDVAVNHNADAVAMHATNHPTTTHHRADVFEVDPREATGGRPVGLLWASPDCTFHSKARGGKPIRHATKRRRALAWVVTRWAGTVRPDVIVLENVEEFQDWCPLIASRDKEGRMLRLVPEIEIVKGEEQITYRTEPVERGTHLPIGDQALRADRSRLGKTFRQWVRSLRRLGYVVEWRELRACDYGAPTTRKRLYLIARCDGKPIVWPAATHGQSEGDGARLPYRTAAECIDWSRPMPSIFLTPEEAVVWAREHNAKVRAEAKTMTFATKNDRKAWIQRHRVGTPKRPLADNTLRRIARGIDRFVLNGRPYIVANNTNNVPHGTDEPAVAVTTGGRHLLAVPVLVQTGYGERPATETRKAQAPRALDLHAPLGAVVPTGKHGLVVALMAQYNNDRGGIPKAGHSLDGPTSTITTTGSHQALVTAHLTRFNQNAVGSGLDAPSGAVMAGATAHGLVSVHMLKQHGTSHSADAQSPLGAIATGGHHAVVAASLVSLAHGEASKDGTKRWGAGVHGLDGALGTITTTNNAALVAAFLVKYYGQGIGQSAGAPADTVTTRDRFGIVTVEIDGDTYAIVDIAMRMLTKRELYRCQGFPESYVIDRGEVIDPVDGAEVLSGAEQGLMVGNSVCPPVACALARANVPHMIARPELRPSDRRPRRHAKAKTAEVLA